MISSADFNSSLPRVDGASAPPPHPRKGPPTVRHGEADDELSGRTHDRQRAVLMTASGQLRDRLRAVSRGRRHTLFSTALRHPHGRRVAATAERLPLIPEAG